MVSMCIHLFLIPFINLLAIYCVWPASLPLLQIVSNGVYKSIEHRVSLNFSKERLSVATFHSSNLNSELGPANSLVGPHNPAVFRRVMLEKYFKDFFARKLEGKSYLEQMRIENMGDHAC